MVFEASFLRSRLIAAGLVLVMSAGLARAQSSDGPTLEPPSTQPKPTQSAPPSSKPAATTQPARQFAIPNDPDATFRKALEFERSRNWPNAIKVYAEAVEIWPSRTDFSHRKRLCETHQRIVRRYQDRSFRDVLLRLPQGKALELYDELMERIDTHYVDLVPLEPLVRRGLDNMEVALRDPNVFKANNLGTPDPDRVAWLRKQLRARRDALSVPDLPTARNELIYACQLADQALGLNPAAVSLEFVFGACDALDEYTSYLTPDKLEDMFSVIDGNFVGLGVELKSDDDGLQLVGVIKGGPAFDAGLKSGDRITRVGGLPVKGLGLDEAANRLQGTEGSPIDITVVHNNGKAEDLRLIRRHVEVESVSQAKMLETNFGIGYIQLTGFQKSSAEEMDRAVAELKRQGMRYLILDLRGNPGGLLNIAVEIADRFVGEGVIVSTRGRAPGQTQIYRARPDVPFDMKVAVLVDRDSASASEILAGALKELDRAVVIGDRSYGKGSVQSIFELRSVPAGLKLTTAKFYSPKNHPYSEQGVSPDILVRAVAKPVNGQKVVQDWEPGDPARDPAVRTAIQQARQSLSASR